MVTAQWSTRLRAVVVTLDGPEAVRLVDWIHAEHATGRIVDPVALQFARETSVALSDAPPGDR